LLTGNLLGLHSIESDNKLATYHSWFACPLVDLQAGSHTQVLHAAE